MINAVVVPNVPDIGANINSRTDLLRIGSPRVYIPDNGINISAGEVMKVDGTLIINGSLIGSGLPQPENPAEALNNLTDVSLGNINIGEVLKFNGERWTNQPDEEGLTAVSINEVDGVVLSEPEIGQVLKYDGLNWVNDEDSFGGNRLSTLSDVDPQGLADGVTLQYNAGRYTWEFVNETDFVDAVIDGGHADSEPDYVEAFDIDGGYA